MAPRTIQMDLAISDVHKAAASEPEKRELISAGKRKSLEPGQFALPSKRKYPIDTAARTRNAAARLEQAKKRGTISDSDYADAKGRIARAAKKFRIESEYNASDDVGRGDGRRRVPRSIHVRADLAPGGGLHVRHMTGRRFFDGPGVLLTEDDRKADGAVWVQIARQGSFLGHPAGPFKLDLQTFHEIIANFKATENQHIAWDFEHASEQDPTSGSIPSKGAPAQGWITDLKIENGNLYGLTEWGETAREYIRDGKYRYCSPAIRFGSKDRVTGKPIGARLTSVALTNEPFLDALEPLAAKDGASLGSPLTLGGHLGKPMHSPGEYMPQLKSALKLDALSSPQQCADKLDRLRECCMSVGLDGVHMGESMSDYTRPMRDLVGAAPGMTGEELFDIIEDLIGHAIEQHNEELHGVSPDMDDTDPSGDDFTMTDAEKQRLADLEAEVTTLKDKAAASEARAVAAETLAKKAPVVVTLKEGETPAAAIAREFKLTLKEGESFGQAVTRVIAENATLSEQNNKLLKDIADRKEADTLADVDAAFSTYKDVRRLKDTDKPHMLAHARSDRASFTAMYPPVAPGEAHLLQDLVKQDPARDPVVPPEQVAEAPVLSFTELTRHIQLTEKKTLAEAQVEAARRLRDLSKGDGK